MTHHVSLKKAVSYSYKMTCTPFKNPRHQALTNRAFFSDLPMKNLLPLLTLWWLSCWAAL